MRGECRISHRIDTPNAFNQRFYPRSAISFLMKSLMPAHNEGRPTGLRRCNAPIIIGAGNRGIWNFTPVKLKVPDSVVARKEDLAEGLAVLSHHLQLINNRLHTETRFGNSELVEFHC